MLRSVKEITGYRLEALDGKIGRCKDFLFDDRRWTIRYMVADTGRWLPGRKVLIPPTALDEPEWKSHSFPVLLEKQKIEEAPALDEHAPVSRQYEEQYHAHFGWPYYWAGVYAGSPGAFAPPVYENVHDTLTDKEELDEEALDEPRLRSAEEVAGYHIHATDGEIGHVEDFIVDDNSWIISYMVVDTRNWLPGRKVLVAPGWIDRVDWAENMVYVDLSRENVKNSPEYNPSEPVNREYEEQLYNYYGQPIYWA